MAVRKIEAAVQKTLELARWKSPGRSGHPLLELVALGTPRGVLHELLPHPMGLVVSTCETEAIEQKNMVLVVGST